MTFIYMLSKNSIISRFDLMHCYQSDWKRALHNLEIWVELVTRPGRRSTQLRDGPTNDSYTTANFSITYSH
jgi:hypothetical protein